MDDDASQPTPHEPDPALDRRDAAARAGDLAKMSEAADDATYGADETGRRIVPGVVSGDVGPKGRVSAQMRSLSRKERATYGEVPRGTVAPGGSLLVLVPMLVIAALIILFVVLVGWLLS
jgi:hypothetical protein